MSTAGELFLGTLGVLAMLTIVALMAMTIVVGVDVILTIML